MSGPKYSNIKVFNTINVIEYKNVLKYLKLE